MNKEDTDALIILEMVYIYCEWLGRNLDSFVHGRYLILPRETRR